jgi:nucleoside-diphosphate-sugar epimerase
MKLSGARILVTGGAGFIGSYLVEDLVRGGAHVRVFDNFSSGLYENLRLVRDDVEIIEGDILDPAAVVEACKGIDAISHQAAQLEIIRCIDDPVADLRINAEGTLNVFQAAKAASIGRVVYASSACVYGQARYTPQDEDHPREPNWPYGVSKYATEGYGKLYHDYYGMQTVGLRYGIVYGPREWYGRVLTAFLRRALDGASPVVWGGTQERDFTFVEDVVACHRRCMEQDDLGASVFNVSTGVATSIRVLAELVVEVCGLGAPPIYEDVAEGQISDLVPGRMRLPAELKQMVLDNRRARDRLGWIPQVALREGLSREFAWLREHPDRWRTMHY